MTTSQNLLADRVAVITGAGRGIGKGIAEAYAEQGAIVVVSDIDEGAAKEVADSLPRAEAVVCDVRDEAAVIALIKGTVERHGKLDICVANAGVGKAQPLAETSLADWRAITSVNLDGVFLTIREAALAMAATGGGSIIGMASITALRGSPLIGHYAAAKAGVVNLCKTAAVEFRPYKVRVNSILPTFIDTDLVRENRSIFEAALGTDFESLLVLKQGRFGTVEDVTPLAVFLASDQSGFVSGSAYTIDNAWTASLL
ncbi:MAG TPA: SDR family NAD(P)-dependent oxidoreductase [Sporichthyaceae bacterium]|jgi:NAD(P)-dependent dehydrogenase (short-subunit alcohol dehydrogenase family)